MLCHFGLTETAGGRPVFQSPVQARSGVFHCFSCYASVNGLRSHPIFATASFTRVLQLVDPEVSLMKSHGSTRVELGD